MFLLRFYGPVNPMGSCWAWSVYWASLVLQAVNQYCAHSFARNWQLPFLNQRKGENDRRKYFMIISTKECCRPRRGLNLQPPGLQSDGASNWATEAGLVVFSESSNTVITLLGKRELVALLVCNVMFVVVLLFLLVWLIGRLCLWLWLFLNYFVANKRSEAKQLWNTDWSDLISQDDMIKQFKTTYDNMNDHYLQILLFFYCNTGTKIVQRNNTWTSCVQHVHRFKTLMLIG